MNSDILQAYRKLIILRLAQTGLFIFMPFALNSFLEGQFVLSSLSLTLNILFMANAVWIHRTGKVLYSPAWLALLMTLVELYGVWAQGMRGLFWHYPVLLFFYLVLESRLAFAINLAMTLLVSPWVAFLLDWHLGLRFLITSLVTIMFIDVFIGNIKYLQAALTDQTLHDPLTGAFNRRHLNEQLTQAIARNKRYGAPWAALTLDLDHFKRINDELGHDAGDEVLKSTVHFLHERLGKHAALFRVGGEEFVILLESKPEEALATANDLCRELAGAEILKDRTVTVSVGMAELREDDTGDSWLKRADEALYEAKRQGRNRVAYAATT